MKRIFALLLCAAMLVSLAACGGSGESAPTDATASATVPATQPSEAPTAAPTDAPTEALTEPPVIRGEMAQTVLVDNEYASFTVIKAEKNEHLGMQLQVQCVNKTDSALLFSWDMVSVCGFMYDPMWAEEVSGGKTANSTVYLDTYQLEQMGIISVDEISFTLRVVDSENWMEEPFVQEAFTIYPTGLNAETLVLPQRADTAGQVVLVDDENVRFVIEWADAEDSAEYTLFVYMQNKTGKNLMYAWDQVSVNGYMIDPFWTMSVTAGNQACSEVIFYRSDLEANGITDVSDIEFTLLVSDYDDWEAAYLLEDTFVYNP